MKIKNLKFPPRADQPWAEKIKNYLANSWVRVFAYLFIPLACLYSFGKPLAADYFYQKARSEVNADQGQTAYKDLQAAIYLSGDNDTYHRAYAQVNLAVGNGLAQTGSPDAKDKVARLVGQAVREAKLAVTLNESDWENAAVAGRTYQTVIGFLPDAKTFAVKYLELAAKLDPYNPTRYLDWGGYYYGEQELDKALTAALKAAALKSDYANAHYSLSAVYRVRGEMEKVKAELRETIKSMPKDSPYLPGIQKELQDLETTPTAK